MRHSRLALSLVVARRHGNRGFGFGATLMYWPKGTAARSRWKIVELLPPSSLPGPPKSCITRRALFPDVLAVGSLLGATQCSPAPLQAGDAADITPPTARASRRR
jgi:hypothetical protein